MQGAIQVLGFTFLPFYGIGILRENDFQVLQRSVETNEMGNCVGTDILVDLHINYYCFQSVHFWRSYLKNKKKVDVSMNHSVDLVFYVIALYQSTFTC